MENVNVNNENGRSMIEMLGVLAIIGVLSVGGIAGYSKAMQKYRINKTIEQITLIAGNIRSFFAPQRSYYGLQACYSDNVYCKLIKKAKLMPDEMWDDTDKKFKNVFGHYVNLATANKAKNNDMQAFSIYFHINAKDYETCIELATYDWTAAGVKGIHIADYGPGFGGYLTSPASIDDAVTVCSAALNLGNVAGFTFFFDINSNCWNETSGNTCS